MKNAAISISSLAFVHAAQAKSAVLDQADDVSRGEGYLDTDGFFTQSDADFRAELGGMGYEIREATLDRFF
jgi:hypothetical protein